MIKIVSENTRHKQDSFGWNLQFHPNNTIWNPKTRNRVGKRMQKSLERVGEKEKMNRYENRDYRKSGQRNNQCR